jgi:hypothetical protein
MPLVGVNSRLGEKHTLSVDRQGSGLLVAAAGSAKCQVENIDLPSSVSRKAAEDSILTLRGGGA